MRLRPLFLLAVVAALLPAVLPPFLGARADDEELPHRTLPFLLRDTNAARFSVEEAKRLLGDGRTSQGLQLAQQVLDEMPGDYYRVESPAASTRWRLASEEIRELLAGLPSEQRAAYDVRTASAARPLLERAIRADARAGLLEGLVSRYGASRAGRRAARLLAERELEAGRPGDAADWTREGLRYAPLDPVLWRLRIDALGEAGRLEALRGLDVPPALQASLSPALTAWRSRLADAPPRTRVWPLWGGRGSRDRHAPAEGPRPETLRWTERLAFPPRYLDRETMNAFMRDDSRRFWEWWETFRPLHPAVDERVVYVSNGRSIEAFDVYLHRKVWSFREGMTDALELIPPDAPGEGRTSFERAYAPVVAGDLVLATVEVRHAYAREELQRVEISTYLPRRVLVALDRRTGRLRWWMGQEAGDRRRLDEVTIVSPCVVQEDLVLAVASRYTGSHHVVFFVALDLETGSLRWLRRLGWGQQELNLFGSPVKELAASAPAVRGDVVYATTGLGFVAALEVRTGRPRWIASYEIQPIQPVQYWFRAPLRFPSVAPSPPIAHGDVVLVAPTDGRHLHAFDRFDGRLRWRNRYPGPPRIGAPGHLLGVAHDGSRDVVLFTGTNLEAYALEDGSRQWIGRLQDDLGDRSVPIGRGSIAGETVLIPTDEGLVRFSIPREGSFEGRDPWPEDVEPGNLVPLEQVLLVTTRDALQGFYSWREIEREIQTRKRQRPDDAMVLVEAGEIYRIGGALDRARGAFDEALEMAQGTGDTVAEERAAAGLFRTHLSEADAVRAERPARARDSLDEALRWARTAKERVEVRIRIDALLAGDPDARAANLQRLVDESAGVQAVFPGISGPVSARAVALLRLSRAHLDRGSPTEAVDTLQQLLRQEGDARIGEVAARSRARDSIAEIVRVWGREAYKRHEEAAAELLEQALEDDDAEQLDRLLGEYPNASVVPQTLVELGRRRLSEGNTTEGARALRQLLSEHGTGDRAAVGAALLARAYESAGLDGARRYALGWLATRHASTTFELDGRTWDGASYAAASERRSKDPPAPPPRAFRAPLEEVHFEPAGDDAWGSQVPLSHPADEPAPVALFRDGRRLVVFDLPAARVAFDLPRGPYLRAHHDRGVLVLSRTGRLSAFSADAGEALWSREVEGTVTELGGDRGQVFALMRDTGGAGGHALLALDVTQGQELWRLDLGRSDYRVLRTAGPDVLLHQTRYDAGRVWYATRVFDGLTGRLRHVIDLPPQGRMDGDVVVAGRRLLYAADDEEGDAFVTAHDLDTGKVAWQQALPSDVRSSAVVPDGEDVLVLQEDGHLATFRLATGRAVDLTKIFVGERARARPRHDTDVFVAGDHLVLVPYANGPPHVLGAWSRRTGKLAWSTTWPEEGRPSRAAVLRADGSVLALASWTRPRDGASVHLRVLDLETGRLEQDVEPVGLAAEHGLLSLAQGWGTVVVFGRAGASVYASANR